MGKREFHALKASLVFLKFGEKPALGREYFLSGCEAFLEKKELEKLENATLEVPEKAPEPSEKSAAANFIRFEMTLRNTLASLRASRLAGGENHNWKREEDSWESAAAALALAAFQEKNPRERENILDRGRWDLLDEMEKDHVWDLDALLIYFLKLQILEKWEERTLEKAVPNLEKAVTESEKIPAAAAQK